MKRVVLAVSVCALILAGCSKEKTKPATPAASNIILSTTVAPDSAFKMSISFDPPQPRMSSKTKFHLWLTGGVHVTPETPGQTHCSLVMPLMDMGKNEFALQPVGGGEYEGTGQFTMSGEWEVICTAKLTDGGRSLSGKTTFNVRVED